MPHKRNPILSENLCGLSRVVRAAVVPALEDVVLWHERDISHSSTERMIAPDATATLGFMLERAARLVDQLVRAHTGAPALLSGRSRQQASPRRGEGPDPIGRAALGTLFALHTIRFWIYLQPDRGRR